MTITAVLPRAKRAPQSVKAATVDPRAFSYAEVPVEAREYIAVRVERIRTSIRVTAQEVATIGRSLTELRDRLALHVLMRDGLFTRLLRDELGMAPRTARRFMAIAAFIEAHFGGKPPEQIGPSAIYLLANQTTPDEAIAQVMTRLHEGDSISIADVERTIAEVRQAAETTQDQISETLAELGETKQRLDTVTAEAQRMELESHRFREQANRAVGSLEAARRETVLLSEEVATLRSEAAELRRQIESGEARIIEKVVEVVPDGYTSLEDALAAKHAEIAKAERRLARIAEEIAAGTRRPGSTGAVAEDAAEAYFEALRQDIQGVVTRWPGELMASLAATPAVKSELRPVAALLRRLADQIEGK